MKNEPLAINDCRPIILDLTDVFGLDIVIALSNMFLSKKALRHLTADYSIFNIQQRLLKTCDRRALHTNHTIVLNQTRNE